MKAERLKGYDPLDIENLDSYVAIGGVITKVVSDNEFQLTSDDGIVLPIVVHPDVLEAYSKKGRFLDVNDEVEMLGTFITNRKKLNVLVLRCVVYDPMPNQTPHFIN